MLAASTLRRFRLARNAAFGGALLALSGCSSPGSGEPSGPAEPDWEVARHGLVALEARLPNPERGPRLNAAAFFWQASTDEGNGCEVVSQTAECELLLCIPVEAAAVPLPGFAWLSAGTVEVSGTKLDFRFTEAELGEYEPTLPSRDMSLWDGGELLNVTVTGSDAYPALTTSVTAPRPVLLTRPDLSRGSVEVNPRAGYTLEWSSPRVDSVRVELEERRATPYSAPRDALVRCEFPAAGGRGVVPAALFGALSDPSLLHGYRIRVSTASEAELTVGEASFTFVALSESREFEADVLRMGNASAARANRSDLTGTRPAVESEGLR